jgi:hypothetical protein
LQQQQPTVLQPVRKQFLRGSWCSLGSPIRVRPYVTAYAVSVLSPCSLVHLGCLAPAVIACFFGSPRPSVAVRGAHASSSRSLPVTRFVCSARRCSACSIPCPVLIRRSPRGARSSSYTVGSPVRPVIVSARSVDPAAALKTRGYLSAPSKYNTPEVPVRHPHQYEDPRPFIARIRLFSEDHGTFDQPCHNAFQPSHPFEDQKLPSSPRGTPKQLINRIIV